MTSSADQPDGLSKGNGRQKEVIACQPAVFLGEPAGRTGSHVMTLNEKKNEEKDMKCHDMGINS